MRRQVVIGVLIGLGLPLMIVGLWGTAKLVDRQPLRPTAEVAEEVGCQPDTIEEDDMRHGNLDFTCNIHDGRWAFVVVFSSKSDEREAFEEDANYSDVDDGETQYWVDRGRGWVASVSNPGFDLFSGEKLSP